MSIKNMKNELNSDRAKRFGEAFAASLFKDMPAHAGPKFTWKSFPTFAARLAEASLFMACPRSTKHLPHLERLCRRAAYRKAKDLLKLLR